MAGPNAHGLINEVRTSLLFSSPHGLDSNVVSGAQIPRS